MSDLTKTLNGFSPDENGRYSDAQLDAFERLLISGASISEDVIKQLAARHERKNGAESSLDSDHDQLSQDGLS